MQKKTEANKGITLIALIITIIVLLILAGVSITILTGENGILKQATNARNENLEASLKEEVQLALQNRKIEEELGKNKSLKEELEKGINGNKIVEEIYEFTDVYYVTKNDKSITVYEDGTIIEGKIDIWDGKSKSKPAVDEEGNWHIYNTNELKYFADFVNGNLTEEEKGTLQINATTIVYLEKDLDLGARQVDGILKSGEKWLPIGKDSSNKFIGTFEGNHHFIMGVYIDRVENYAGFFGISNNMIQNLTLKNSYILGANCVGGIVGYGDNVQDCHNIKTPVICREGNYHTAGGIAGQINKTIKNCSNSGDVTVKGSFKYSNCGGIMGGSQSGEGVEIDNCVNYGEVTGKEASIGGVVGTWRSLSTFSNCINKGNVKGKGNVGGVIGQANSKSTINNCANSGKVSGDASHTGGIIGLMSRNNTTLENSSKLEKCYNTGEITGKYYTGGIVGRVAGEE